MIKSVIISGALAIVLVFFIFKLILSEMRKSLLYMDKMEIQKQKQRQKKRQIYASNTRTGSNKSSNVRRRRF